jgi:hypothetical protein
MEIVSIFSYPGQTLQAALTIGFSHMFCLTTVLAWDILSLYRVSTYRIVSTYRCVINDVIGDDYLACPTF